MMILYHFVLLLLFTARRANSFQLSMTSPTMISALNKEIKKSTGLAFNGVYSNGVGSGGSGASAFVIEDKEEKISYFVKQSDLSRFEMLRCEFEGIREMSETKTIKVPKPICFGTSEYNSFVVFEKLSLGGCGDVKLGGEKLAQMHSNTSKNNKFGWDFTNTIGATPQPNEWTDSWPDFWDKCRLGHIIKLCKAEGATFPEEQELRAKVRSILERHTVAPSPVHGDLWAGNFGWTKDGEPVIYDPAFYYGDSEVDIAMSKLFGSQSRAFYDAYDKVIPPKSGREIREVIYNLYHILNHYVLFGGGYLSQGKMMIGKILKYSILSATS